jgi:hypothetical protein
LTLAAKASTVEAPEFDPTVELGMLEDVRLADVSERDCFLVESMAADLAGTWEAESVPTAWFVAFLAREAGTCVGA